MQRACVFLSTWTLSAIYKSTDAWPEPKRGEVFFSSSCYRQELWGFIFFRYKLSVVGLKGFEESQDSVANFNYIKRSTNESRLCHTGWAPPISTRPTSRSTCPWRVPSNPPASPSRPGRPTCLTRSSGVTASNPWCCTGTITRSTRWTSYLIVAVTQTLAGFSFRVLFALG